MLARADNMMKSKRLVRVSVCLSKIAQVLELLRDLLLEHDNIAAVLDDLSHSVVPETVHLRDLLLVSSRMTE